MAVGSSSMEPGTHEIVEKVCRDCHLMRPIAEFRPYTKKGRAYRNTRCDTCRRSDGAMKKRAQKAREKVAPRASCTRCGIACKTTRWNLCPDCSYLVKITRMYGITVDEYLELLASQEGKCAICSQTVTSSRANRLSIDHCHTTGKVRGLLCGNCNHGLGNFGDDVERLQAAIRYLSK